MARRETWKGGSSDRRSVASQEPWKACADDDADFCASNNGEGLFVTNPSLNARIAGFLYLVVVVATVFALATGSGMTARGDAAATSANIVASEQMFRAAFAANLIAAVAYTAVVGILYPLFKPVNPTLSTVAAFIGLAGCATSAAF